MTVIDIRKAAIQHFIDKHKPATEVRLHPADMAAIINGLQMWPDGERLYGVGLEWIEDARIPEGQFRLA